MTTEVRSDIIFFCGEQTFGPGGGRPLVELLSSRITGIGKVFKIKPYTPLTAEEILADPTVEPWIKELLK